MDRIDEIIKEVNDLEVQLEELRKEYLSLVEPCHNTDCDFYNEKHNNRCSWTWWITTCRDYRDEKY